MGGDEIWSQAKVLTHIFIQVNLQDLFFISNLIISCFVNYKLQIISEQIVCLVYLFSAQVAMIVCMRGKVCNVGNNAHPRTQQMSKDLLCSLICQEYPGIIIYSCSAYTRKHSFLCFDEIMKFY